MKKIGLIDVDSHNFPNLALMKISAYHKEKGDTVEWAIPLDTYNIVYQSKVFDETYSPEIMWIPQADEIINYVFNRKAPIRSFRDVAKAKGICEMRAAGFTYEEIGKEFNLSPTRARQYIVRTMGIYRHRKEKEARSEKIKIIKVKQGTNYDKIRNMSIEEMAKCSIPFFGCPYEPPYITCFYNDCVKCRKAWLESEVEE